MFYDDATGRRRALRRGEDVPADFPEVSLVGPGFDVFPVKNRTTSSPKGKRHAARGAYD